MASPRSWACPPTAINPSPTGEPPLMPNTLHKMDGTGDSKLMWNSDVAVEVDAAKKMFDDLRGKGYLAFTVKKDGDKGTQITAFDKFAEKIIMAPPLRGGD